MEASLFKGFSKNFKYSVLMHETRPSGGARWVMVPCEPDMISNRSDVIDHGLPVVCGLYYTIQTIRYHKNVIHVHIKTCPDYSICDQLSRWLAINRPTGYVVYPVVYFIIKCTSYYFQKTWVRT